MADDRHYAGFYIGHLHIGERNRIQAGNLNPHERDMLNKGEDPWAKFRGPDRVTAPQSEIDVPTPDKWLPQTASTTPTKGTRVLGQTASETDEERRLREEKQIETEVVATMHPQDREKYNDPGTPKERRAAIFETYKGKFDERKRREHAAFLKELERTAKAQDLLHTIKTDPSKAHLPWPINDSKEALLEWYDEMRKPRPPTPFAGSIDAGARAHGDVWASQSSEDESRERDTSKEPPKRKGMDRELEKRYEEQDSTRGPNKVQENRSSLAAIEESLKRVLDTLPPVESPAETRKKLTESIRTPQRSVEDITGDATPKFASAERPDMQEFRIADVMEPAASPPVISPEPQVTIVPDQEKVAWFHRIPVWREFGPWLKWASAGFGFAVAMTQVNEYGWAMAGLVLCGVCCLGQIYVWTASPSRFRNTAAKSLLALLSVTMLMISGLTVIKIKGEKPWSNLLEQGKTSTLDQHSKAETTPVMSSPSTAKPSEERVFTDVDPAYLVSLYEQYSTAQADQAVKTYIGKWITVTGTVNDVTREDHLRAPSTVRVSIYVETSSKDRDGYTVVASFEDQAAMDRALVLSRKERISVLGKIRRVIEPGILLDNCQLIAGGWKH